MLYTFSVFVFPQEIRRIDVYLASIFKDVSRSFVQRLIEKEYVKCNGKNADKNFKLRRGDVIEVHFVTEKMDVEAEDLPLEVIFENEEFAVVSKDAGVNTHPVPGVGGNSGTLVNALLHRFGGLSVIGGVERPGIVHRLDKDTSGLLVIAKSDRSMAQLQKRMNDRTIEKHYLALVVGVPSEASGFIESYIGRDRHDRKKMTADNPINPKLAKTRFRVVSTSVDGRYALLDIELLTGRTHQIRVHLSGIGFPIV
jgi:23S rRNA pseudouridine1911/1915/1917 synthase